MFRAAITAGEVKWITFTRLGLIRNENSEQQQSPRDVKEQKEIQDCFSYRKLVNSTLSFRCPLKVFLMMVLYWDCKTCLPQTYKPWDFIASSIMWSTSRPKHRNIAPMQANAVSINILDDVWKRIFQLNSVMQNIWELLRNPQNCISIKAFFDS